MLSERTVNQMVVAMVLLLHECGDTAATMMCRNIPVRRRTGPRLVFRGSSSSRSTDSRSSSVAFHGPTHCSLFAVRSRSGRILWSWGGQGGNDVTNRALALAGAEQRRRWAAPAALGAGAPDETVSTVGAESEGSDGGSLHLSKVAQAYYDRKREAMRAWTQERRSRDLCARCRRARQTCLCSSLPAEAVPTSTRFIILQHPTENKKRVTGTVPLVLHCLNNCRRVVVRYDYSEDDLRAILGVSTGGGGSGGSPLLLFPFPDAEYLEDIAASRNDHGEAAVSSTPPPPPPPPGETAVDAADKQGDTASSSSLSAAQQPRSGRPPSPPGAVVVVIDGTWSQAKQILARYPFLRPRREKPASGACATGGDPTKRHGGRDGRHEKEEEEEQDGKRERDGGEGCFRPVKFRSAGVSGYGFRREPAKECLSTLESVAYTLEVLEGTSQGRSAAGYLRTAFAAMVAMQVEAADAAGSNPRFVNRKERTANRRLTPKKG